jgi:hypothetical protein
MDIEDIDDKPLTLFGTVKDYTKYLVNKPFLIVKINQ